MLQQYLISKSDFTGEIKSLASTIEGVSISEKPFRTEENNEIICLSFSCANGNGEQQAEKLSVIHKSIVSRKGKKVITLVSDSSAYYTKELYPIVGDFERKLRNFIYKCYAKSETFSNVSKLRLDKDTFGQVSKKLFYCDSFISGIYEIVKNKNFTKNQLLKKIEDTPEETLWSKIGGESVIPGLENSFGTITKFRNDVMHSHNITHERYLDAKRLYTEFNDKFNEVVISDKFANEMTEAMGIIAFAIGSFADSIKEMKKEIAINNSLNVMKYVLETVSKVLAEMPTVLQNSRDEEEE